MKYTLTLLFLALGFIDIKACTIIIGYKNGQVLVGNNEDWYHSDAKYWFEKPENPEENYAAYFFGFEGEGRFAQGGVNESGLMFDGTAVTRIEINRDHVREHELKAAPVHLFKNILKRCRTIEEAEAMIKPLFIPYIRSAQVVIVDANAGYLVVKPNGITQKGHLSDGEFKVITNFHLEDFESRNYTCYRYDLAISRLEKHFENSLTEFEGLLSSVHQEYPGATVYSNIFDLTAATCNLYYNAVFDEKITLDFEGSISENPVPLEEGLFKKRMIEALIKAHKKGGAAEAADYFTAERNHTTGSVYQVDAQQLIDLGEYLYRQGEVGDYQYILNFAGSTFPQDERVVLALGKSNLRNGRIDAALEAFARTLEIDPENYWAGRLLEAYSDQRECATEFSLKGYENASSVLLYGNFNEWRGFDNACRLVDGTWTTCVSTREKELQYRFKVDGEWVEDPANPSSQKLRNGLKVSVKSMD